LSIEIERDRLLSLVEFAQQSARLRTKPTATIASHGLFSLYEHHMQGLPGIRVNVNGPEGEDEIWLGIKRLHETKPPDVGTALLRAWVQMTPDPNEEPALREGIDGATLIAAGIPCQSATTQKQGERAIDSAAIIVLSGDENAELVRAELTTYLETRWRPWAEEEKLRRKTIRLYAQLFTLKQQLEGGMVQAPLELVWGVGIGIWNFHGTSVSYPLLGRLVEMSLNPDTAELEIRPRDVDARLELEWYASVDNPGVAEVEKVAKEFFSKATTTFSPFDRGAFEPLLRTAVTNLDANGMYWPDEVSADDRTLPKSNDELKITDTWVLFARQRTNNFFCKIYSSSKSRLKERPAIRRRWLQL
jgi:hypothetical protein